MTSKYSALPDIDDQPDVFETPDLTDNSPNVSYQSQLQSSDDEGNEEVIKSRVSVKDAANRFKSSIVDATDTDFSDRLTRRKKAMYRTFVKKPTTLETKEYEILPKELTLEETPLQKLRRLMYETQELNDEMEKTKELTDTKEAISHADILSQIAYLQSDLVRLNQQIGDNEDFDQKSNFGRSIDEAKSLIKQLQAFKSSSQQVSTETKENTANETDENSKNNMITYELYYTPEAAKMKKENKLSDIDQRIATIEKLVGSSAGQGLDELPPNLASTSLINSLAKLEQQVNVLAQPRQLELVTRRVKALNSDLDRLNELKSGSKNTAGALNFGLSSTLNNQNTNATNNEANKEGNTNDSETKINKLFDTLEKVDPLLNLTPVLLTRLKALQSLHTEAITFGQSVKIISEEQTRMTDELKSLSSACELLNKSLTENDTSLTNNITIIDEKMTDLVQRVNTLTSK